MTKKDLLRGDILIIICIALLFLMLSSQCQDGKGSRARKLEQLAGVFIFHHRLSGGFGQRMEVPLRLLLQRRRYEDSYTDPYTVFVNLV